VHHLREAGRHVVAEREDVGRLLLEQLEEEEVVVVGLVRRATGEELVEDRGDRPAR
jgi:hypothetical protein